MKSSSTRRTIVTSKDLAYENLKPSEQNLYDVLEENISLLRKELLIQGRNPEQRQELFKCLSDCKDLQTRLISELQSSDDTQAVDLKAYKAAVADPHRVASQVKSSEDTQDVDLRFFKPQKDQ